MGRYTGPKHKLARREGVNILDKASASLQRRLNIPPGIHGKKMKRRTSEYGTQLREKQKLKGSYGLMEKQLRNLVKKAQAKRGDTGETLITLLETRLDNVVYRLGFTKSRFQSRQFVSHGHVTVNDKKVTIPSYQVTEGDIVGLSSKMQKKESILKAIEEQKEIAPFLQRSAVVGKVVRMPKSEDIRVPFSIQLIIEYYSR